MNEIANWRLPIVDWLVAMFVFLNRKLAIGNRK